MWTYVVHIYIYIWLYMFLMLEPGVELNLLLESSDNRNPLIFLLS